MESLRTIAIYLGRRNTDAKRLGRAPEKVHRVATLVVGMGPGSTTLLFRRAGAGEGALDFDVADERAFDHEFQRLVESVADGERPEWVGDPLAGAAAQLVSALSDAAPDVQFTSGGRLRRRFATADLDQSVWSAADNRDSSETAFVGKLLAANLSTHRLEVHDDAGHRVALPDVPNVDDVWPLLTRYVVVTGITDRDAEGRVNRITRASVVVAPDPVGSPSAPVSVDDILASAAGVKIGGIDGLTDDEASAFFDAMGL